MRIILISVLLSLAASQSVDIQEPPAGIIISVLVQYSIVSANQVRGAVGGTTMAGVAALHNSRVVWVRVTVTDLWMAGLTMVTRDVGGT